MTPTPTPRVITLLAAITIAAAAHGADDLSSYRTVDTAVRAKSAQPIVTTSVARIGYLGIAARQEKGKLIAGEVATGGPAARAGVEAGDVIVSVDGKAVAHAEELRQAVHSRNAGDTLAVVVRRKSKKLSFEITLAAVSRPLTLEAPPVTLGARLGSGAELEGAPIDRITTNGPASKAGLKLGDLVMKIDGVTINDGAMLTDSLVEKKAGDVVTLKVRRASEDLEVQVTLAEDKPVLTGSAAASAPRVIFKKPVYRLAIIGIEYPDVKHNELVTTKDWEEALFSIGAYRDKDNPTGQPVYGSVNDYYKELSGGKLRIEGKVFDWVEVSKKRAEYSFGSGTGDKTAVMIEAMDRLVEREGPGTLRGYDGIFFIYAGERFKTTRGGVYWPHRSSLTWGKSRIPYLIIAEGGPRMANISVMCHEFGHMIGLPDQYARPENPGSEGASSWCAMSNQLPNGRPQHFCAWCKEQMGWLSPAVIDPTVPQKLVLGPVERSSKECFKVLVRSDGSEYLLLENRRRIGWDAELAAEGLLIWRVVGGRPLLEESHGIAGPAGPSVFRSWVPYPSSANNGFTPYTTPSSRSQLGGGLPVHITNIRQLADGRITFEIGYEYE